MDFCRNNGDRGRTDAFVRECCKLEKRDKEFTQFSFDKGIVCGAEVNCELDDESTIDSNPNVNFQRFSMALMRELCDRKMDCMTKSYFLQRARNIKGSTMSRDDIWNKLVKPGSGWTVEDTTGKQKNAIRPCIQIRRDRQALFGETDNSLGVIYELPEICSVTAASLPCFKSHLYLSLIHI